MITHTRNADLTTVFVERIGVVAVEYAHLDLPGYECWRHFSPFALKVFLTTTQLRWLICASLLLCHLPRFPSLSKTRDEFAKGGGVAAKASSVEMIRCTFEGNSAAALVKAAAGDISWEKKKEEGMRGSYFFFQSLVPGFSFLCTSSSPFVGF